MRIIITGGAGCLGSNLIEHWLPQGHEILVIDNFATGKREVVPALPGLSLVEGSIADRDLVAKAFAEFAPTHLVHSAASYKDPANYREDIATNVDGTAVLIEFARAAGSAGPSISRPSCATGAPRAHLFPSSIRCDRSRAMASQRSPASNIWPRAARRLCPCGLRTSPARGLQSVRSQPSTSD